MAAGRINALVQRLADVGAHRDDTDEDRLRAGTLILVSVGIALLSFFWIGIYVAYGYYAAAAIPFAYQVITLLGLLVLARTKRFAIFRTTELVVWLLFPALLQITLGGFVASGGIILWGVMVPLAAAALFGPRRSLAWLVGFVAIVLVLTYFNDELMLHPAVFPPGMYLAFVVLNILGLTVAAYALLAYFVDQSDRARTELTTERERSEMLLHNVLPEPIAERLKRRDGGVIAEQFDQVTVLFADIEGFTGRTAALTPEQLVRLLDRIFSTFDALADIDGLEKIKTIGDAYMVVGGVPRRRADHAIAVARLALAMRTAIDRIATGDLEGLRIRIGIDTGPAVAGVIGKRKFIYDVWGDTVNAASRMESHGLPGEIQMTERAAAALDGTFDLEPRGLIDVKGMGLVETYLLRGRRL